MTSVLGTTADDIIRPGFVSDGVTTDPPGGTPGAGRDRIRGEAGDDRLAGGRGNDAIFGGAGDDRIRARPGDGGDRIAGGEGRDTAVFTGNARAEAFTVANGFDGARVFSGLDFFGTTLRRVETIVVDAGRGADDISVDLLDGTGVQHLTLRLGDDAAADVVSFLGTGGAELLALGDAADGFTVLGGGVETLVREFDNAADRLILSLGEGADTIDAAALGAVDLIVAAGSGDDVGVLGAGDDIWAYVGAGGNDAVHGGAGTDTFELDGGVESFGYVITGDATAAIVGISNTTVRIDLGGFERIDIEAFSGDDAINAQSLRDVRTRLDGGAGDDTLTGGFAADLLAGGAGDDILRGGVGGDRFLFGTEDGDGVQDHDVIADFSKADGDVIDIRPAVGLFLANAVDEGILITLLSGGDLDSILVLGAESLADLNVVF